MATTPRPREREPREGQDRVEAGDQAVVRTSVVYHYLLQPSPETIAGILARGLCSLTEVPAGAERLAAIERVAPGHFAKLYAEWAEPVLQRPYPGRSGVFLTPIDFRLLPGSLLEKRPRVAVPLGRLQPEWSIITYAGGQDRVCLPLTDEALQAVARAWPAKRVNRWFATDTSRLFFHVPQVVTYQPGGLPVAQSEIDHSVE